MKAFFLVLSISAGVLGLLILLNIIMAATRKKMEQAILQKFNKEDLLAANPRANFFGMKSKGGRQIRGNGALVLTKNELYFLRACPEMEYRIPIEKITGVSLPKSFNGKSIFYPLLCITYQADNGEDAMAWAVREPKKWKAAIEELVKTS
jgi:hypothetical protein